MARAATTKQPTRIQKEKRRAILAAALDVFSAHGFRGATLDQIADAAGLSKPNLLYYFDSKEAIHQALLTRLLDTWLDPLRQIDPQGDPLRELTGYIRRKLKMSRDYPRESRLFANEILQGAPRMQSEIEGALKALVDEKTEVIRVWIAAGRIAPVDPYHLIFSIWATTQHYADFEVQVQGILGAAPDGHVGDAATFLTRLYTDGLRPR
ncbi:TetR family transcriptional regulator [Halovulum dunhuangense]|uniref:TetR family transcriptional regulator n=1 Tax=Halovulum dunhuangense TaxID=1505036 RepID=A0A849KVP8_9RHOB|nr:TetR family transcriptional regulator C-terminal domain-containing protein [Halovulum dunhuangense]NNU79498.1 TetR family transcriptional regulator [Halovulum dunhuangense]